MKLRRFEIRLTMEYRFVGKVLCAVKTVMGGDGEKSGGGGGAAVWLDRSVYCIIVHIAGFSRLSLSEIGELLEFH